MAHPDLGGSYPGLLSLGGALPDTSTLLTHTLDWYHGGLLSLLLFTSAGVVAWTLLALYTTLLAHLLVHPLLEAL